MTFIKNSFFVLKKKVFYLMDNVALATRPLILLSQNTSTTCSKYQVTMFIGLPHASLVGISISAHESFLDRYSFNDAGTSFRSLGGSALDIVKLPQRRPLFALLEPQVLIHGHAPLTCALLANGCKLR